MVKVTIEGIEIDVEAHKKNTEAQQEAIFAHLPYYKRKDAMKQLQEAFSAKAAPKQEPPKEKGV